MISEVYWNEQFIGTGKYNGQESVLIRVMYQIRIVY